ncbi:hypothetical protein MATL_G00213630 [Megalops atlanticus]|uniref:E3 ubiquitin-protein ligase n=1 Tax=Megalops atlanticus TaxID=7932 RepID=A0A9D3PGF6_MEGAT|nr:hypothetical protein MATL_G00213630 [Megalops atlanticus]
MAAKGCTVRVSGLPTDVEEDRLTDKLYIHFLRGKHGGGEVTAVKIHKAMPGSALITFEDSKVARNVVRYGKHVLLVDDKKYELTVSFPSKEVDPDQVFLCMMVTVDYSWLPLGKEAVTSLHQSLPDVHCSFSLLEQHCTLKGRYSEVQALVTQLLGIVETHVSSDTHSSGTSSVCGSVDHPNNIRELGETTQSKQASGLDLDSLCSISPESPTHSQALEDTGDTEKTTPLRDDPLLEDHSLAMDADIFRYLRQHYGEEYQRILSQHGVEVVDMTARDVTTLFLNARAGGKGRGMQQVQQVQQVHAQISRLYQETEAQLCKEQLPKEHAPKENLQLALEVLQLRLPKVQLGVDDRHISIVGSSSDVLEAKQFLLDQQEEEGDTKPGRAGHDFPPAVSGLDSRVGKMLKTYRGGRTEGGREYKLAARFREAQSKNSGEDGPKQGLMETDSGVGGSLEKPNSTRTNSSASSRESRDVYSAEVKAPTLMWQYMKEAYRTRIEDMTSELKIKEKQLESGVTLVLRGVNPSKVDTCQQELQELVAMVATDFYVQELPLANLSVADPEDETLDMCCAEVRRRFRKVKIELRRESLFIIGPKELCVQVGGALMEVFHNGAEKSKRHEEKLPELEGLSDTSHDTHTKQVTSQLKTKHTQYEESTPKSHTALKGNSLQSRSLSLVDSPQNKLGREMGLGNKKGKDNIQQIDSTRRVCPGVEEVRGIRGTMRWTELPLSLPGHIKDTTLKITYTIPDGLQGVSHPAPGDPFQGGIFEAYLPLNEQTRRLLPQLKRAFTEGLLFTVAAGDRGCRVVWDSVPHKTRVDGGKSGNGYPDSGYLRRLTEALKSLGIEDGRAMSESQDKIKK